MGYFTTSRNIELSLLYYLTTCFTADWSNVSIVKTWKQIYDSDTALPIICVRLAETTSTRLEIGNTTLEDRFLLVIDAFCTSDAQRLDFSDYIKNKLALGWVHYDYSHESGSNLTLAKSANGRDTVTSFVNNTKLEPMETSDVKDRYRQTISILVRKS